VKNNHKEEQNMEYVYSAMLLHSAGQPITEESVKKVLTAAGVKVDAGRVKALVASLEGVNIDEAIKAAAVAPVAAAAAPAEKKEKKKEEKKEEVSQEEAAAGLSALFD
jgi:large subunit ribosomal protein L12